MKILFLTIGDITVASTRARVYGYLPFLSEKNIRFRIISYTSGAKCKRVINLKEDNPAERAFEIAYKIYALVGLFLFAAIYDTVFIQKVILPKRIWSILRLINKNIIFDFDDALYLYRDMSYVLRDSEAVVVSNSYLKNFVSKYNRRIHELISPVDVHRKKPGKDGKFITIGWTGSPETSRYLYPLCAVLRRLSEKFGSLNIEFMGIGDNEDFKSCGVKKTDWSIEGEKNYLAKVDIGIMPLEADEWSQSKAGYKLLLFMSYGIPCVASPVGVNSQIVEDGVNGYLANTEDEWTRKMASLIEDENLRARLGEEAIKTVEKIYSYDANFSKFYDVLRVSETINKENRI
ncbi:MAG: glycosyltransferase family 4 protein [Candidatus Omnitrophica bacterium]|nr:glycosyltransferase family 4 protein [Candidatus Omnitrophota bacterium]